MTAREGQGPPDHRTQSCWEASIAPGFSSLTSLQNPCPRFFLSAKAREERMRFSLWRIYTVLLGLSAIISRQGTEVRSCGGGRGAGYVGNGRTTRLQGRRRVRGGSQGGRSERRGAACSPSTNPSANPADRVLRTQPSQNPPQPPCSLPPPLPARRRHPGLKTRRRQKAAPVTAAQRLPADTPERAGGLRPRPTPDHRAPALLERLRERGWPNCPHPATTFGRTQAPSRPPPPGPCRC